MSETPAERAEAAATRRRWITLAEVVAVAGVVIAALSLWMTWSDRRDQRAERSAAQATAARAQTAIVLRGTVANGGDSVALADANQRIESVDVAFPPALGAGTRTGMVPPQIDADWFAGPLLKATDGGADTQEGRLPVLVTAYWSEPGDDAPHHATATYDVAWRTGGRLLRGRSLKIEGIVRRERGGTTARLDRLWKRPG